MYIKQDEINKYFNGANWKKSHQLYTDNSIQSLNIEKVETGYQVIGTVKDGNNLFTGNVVIDNGGNVLSFSCDCKECQNDEVACSHIGVLLLKFYGLEAKDIPYSFNNENNYLSKLKEITKKRKQRELETMIDDSRELISNYRYESLQSDQTYDTNVHITPVIQITFDRIYISYKIGCDKYYVIKDLREFINWFKRGEVYNYGKCLTVYHDMNNFDNMSKSMILFIETNLNSLVDNKTIKIDNNNIDDFFLYHLRCLDINLKFTTIDYKNVTLVLDKEEDYTSLSKRDTEGELIYGNKYVYYLHNNVLNRYSLNYSTLVGPILKKLEFGNIIIDNQDLTNFSKFIFDQIMVYVDIEGDSIDEYLPVDVSLVIYVDINTGNQLSLSLEFLDDKGIIINNIEDYVLTLKLDHILGIIDDKLEYDELTDLYMMSDESKIYDFLFTDLPSFNKDCEVYVSEGIKRINKPQDLDFSLRVSLKNNLLEIDLKSINIDKDEIQGVITAYQNKKAFHRLKNGDFVNLDNEALVNMTHLIDDLHIKQDHLQEGTIYLDKANALYLNQIIEDNSSINFEKDASFGSLVDNIQHISRQDYPLDSHYQEILRDYQVIGYKWLNTMSDMNFGGILADDMGLGKTIQIISYLDNKKFKSNLVITPATLILNWKDEIAKFAPNLKVLCIMGNLKARQASISSIDDYDIVVTSYDYMRKDYDLYKDYNFDNLIIDEAQYIKNHITKNAKSVKQLNAKHRFALTGTPIENSLAELWSIFDFLMPNYLYSYNYFRDYFERPIVVDQNESKQLQLKQMVEPFILRRNKKDVLDELPDKIENDIKISFSEEEEKVYLSSLATINSDLQEHLQVSNKIDKIEILAMMTRLRQLCCDQRIVDETITKPSSKMDACMNIIRNAHENKQKVLLFSSFTTTLDLLEKELRKDDISYYVLTGSTNKIKRHQLVNSFQKDDTTVFLISLKAGGTGLNLTSASIVIHFDPWWNLSSQNQATDRAYRIGQTNNVQVYKLIMKNSIEEKIQDLQNMKQDLSNIFVENSDVNITNMTNEDIINLFK